MDITRRIRAYFSRKALASGRASFEAGRGHVVKNGAGRIRVRVEDDGGASAVAELAGRGNLLQASCTCPAFDFDYRPCGHIWTAALLADAQGLLVDLPVSCSMRIATGPSPSRIEALGETGR